MYLSAADLCHLYDLQQISPMDMAKKHGMFAVRDSAQGLTVYMIYTLIIVVIMLALIWKFLKGDRKKRNYSFRS